MTGTNCDCHACTDEEDGCAHDTELERCPEFNEEHCCPYKAEINDDHETLCTCCPCARYQCALDI